MGLRPERRFTPRGGAVKRPSPIAITAILSVSFCAWLSAFVLVTRVPFTVTSPTPAAPAWPAVAQQAPAPARSTTAAPVVDYDHDVRAILEENCLECHSQNKRKGGLSLAAYGDILEGGRSGAVVRPGNSARSLILDRLTGTIEPQMPKDELALDPTQIDLIRRWIDQGARMTPSSPPAPQPWEAPLALT